MTRLTAGAGALGIIYALTLASTDPLDLATGMLLGGLLVGLLGRRMLLAPEGHAAPAIPRILWFVVFVVVVVGDILRGAWDVALRVMHLRPIDRAGVVRVPIGERSERGIAVSALASTLSPGSVLIDVDRDTGELLLHVIDASDPDGIRDHLQRFYDRYQRRVFP